MQGRKWREEEEREREERERGEIGKRLEKMTEFQLENFKFHL